MQKCKGCRDLASAEMLRFRQVEDVFRRTAQGWGYQEIRTPTLEYLYLFTSAGTLTPGMLRRVYSFLDWDGWSGERVVLKPDATIPAARLYIEQLAAQKLARLYYVTNTFVFEETGAKSRERWQCGAELVGAGTPLADAELVAFALETLRGLGLKDVTIRLSHAGLIRDLLTSLGLGAAEQSRLFDDILDGRLPAPSELGASPEATEALGLLFSNKGKTPGFLKNVRALYAARLPQFQATLDSFIATLDAIDQLGAGYEIDLAAGKGFEYYTGFIFRLYAGGENVGGGGRYDQLIPMMGGPQAPAAGFALYMDRLMAQVAPQTNANASRVAVRVAPDLLQDGLKLMQTLHQHGLITELALDGEPPAGYDWQVEVKRAGGFVVSEFKSGRAATCAGLPEVLQRLGCA